MIQFNSIQSPFLFCYADLQHNNMELRMRCYGAEDVEVSRCLGTTMTSYKILIIVVFDTLDMRFETQITRRSITSVFETTCPRVAISFCCHTIESTSCSYPSVDQPCPYQQWRLRKEISERLRDEKIK